MAGSQRATPQQLGVPAPLGEAAGPGEACAPSLGGVSRGPKGAAYRRPTGTRGLRPRRAARTGPITVEGKAVSSQNAPKDIVQNDKNLVKELTIEDKKLRSIVSSIN